MADRIVIMKDGHIQQVGTPQEVYHTPANAFVAQFIGSPSMNMLPATVQEGAVALNGGASLAMPGGLATGREILLGVRPDDLRATPDRGLVHGRVQLREPLGHETLIYVDTPGGEVIAKADGRSPPEVGSEVTLGAAPDTVHIFDKTSGEALR